MITRDLILNEARRWVGYTESDSRSLAEYDSPNGGSGRKNFNRFSFIFDRLLDPKTYAGGTKDGLAWCAAFVTTCIGTSTFERKDGLCSAIAADTDRLSLGREMVANLAAAIGLQGSAQQQLARASLLAGVSSFPKFTAIQPVFFDEIKPADLVIFGGNAHIGFVESVGDDGTFTTIEGNTSIGANSDGGAVCRKTYRPSGNGLMEVRSGFTLRSWRSYQFYKLKI